MSFRKESIIKTTASFLLNIFRKILKLEKRQDEDQEQLLEGSYLLQEAKKEWLAAFSFFNNVTERELIDQAIYTLNAAEKRYFFLLSEECRRKGAFYKVGNRVNKSTL